MLSFALLTLAFAALSPVAARVVPRATPPPTWLTDLLEVTPSIHLLWSLGHIVPPAVQRLSYALSGPRLSEPARQTLLPPLLPSFASRSLRNSTPLTS